MPPSIAWRLLVALSVLGIGALQEWKKTPSTNCFGVPRRKGEIVLITDDGFRWVCVPVRLTACARNAHAVHKVSL